MSTSDDPGTSTTRSTPPGGRTPSSDPATSTGAVAGRDASRTPAPSTSGTPPAPAQPSRTSRRPDPEAPNMLPGRARRRLGFERVLVRMIATGGVIGIDVAIGAILAANKVQGWIIGLVVGIVSVVLSAVLWSSRQL